MNPVGNWMPITRVALMLATAGALAGCATSADTTADKGPVAIPQVVTVVPAAPAGPVPKGPQNTGYYPGFSQPLTSASLQMTDDEAAAMQKKLSALGSARRKGTISEAEYKRRAEEMKALANKKASQAGQ